VKVRMFGLNSLDRATTAVESMPLDRNAPTGTSARMWMRTLSRSVSRIRSYRCCGSLTGVGRNTGRYHRLTRISPPGSQVKHSPDPIRWTPWCSVPGSGTYCRVR
jgi:hypothetical protein